MMGPDSMQGIPPEKSPVWRRKYCSTLCPMFRSGTCPFPKSEPDLCGWGRTIKEMHPGDWQTAVWYYI